MSPQTVQRVLQPGDQQWIAKVLYRTKGELKQVHQNWFRPPEPTKTMVPPPPPNPHDYFRRRLFVWAPMRMWGIPMKCPTCQRKLTHSGVYPKAREVVDLDTRYYLIGMDYPKCTKCDIPICPWSTDLLHQLDPAHHSRFPAVLTTQLMKPRTAGNSSSYFQQAIEEVHSHVLSQNDDLGI